MIYMQRILLVVTELVVNGTQCKTELIAQTPPPPKKKQTQNATEKS